MSERIITGAGDIQAMHDAFHGAPEGLSVQEYGGAHYLLLHEGGRREWTQIDRSLAAFIARGLRL